MRKRLTKFCAFSFLMLGFTASIRAEGRLTLSRDDVVVFAGSANMVRLQRAGYLEAMLASAFAASRPKFRDLSWEADTVFRQGTVIERWRKNGFGNLEDQLGRVGTTVVVAQFGKIESMAGPDGLDKFTRAYERLIDRFKKRARLVVLVTPTPFEKPPSALIPDLTIHNSALTLYVKAIARIAAETKLILVDLFTGAKKGLTENGMHIKAEAQTHIAHEIARQLKIPVPAKTNLEPLRLAVIEKHRLWYDYWRPANWKLLYGDDARRQFTRGGKNYIPFKEEWKKLIPRIAQAEQRVLQLADGGEDQGHSRPEPEVLHGDPSANIRKEQASFALSDGLQVNLFASDLQGLTSPLAIRWDPAGRMYVTTTTTYPHVFPGDLPNDKIIVLEDSNRDGRADKSTVFATGLNIPTGLELGDGGVYVGQNTDLLFLQDTDGDGKADRRRIVLSGFGNGDSHQTSNSFVWSPGGELYFGQGDGIESRVETPWGVSSLFQSGFYRFRPRRLQLHPLLNDFMGPGNPWGVAFDEWGQIFSIDGAGGVTWLSPGQIPARHRLRLRTIGKPGGYCGIGYLDGRHLPGSMRGDFAVGDFKANRIKRFSVKPDGAGFSLQWEAPILQSRHRNFRPVDVKVGPDGAIYVVDWYNPIICHQDNAYRDPTRDKAHGRIWRVSSKSPVIKPLNLTKVTINEILDALKSPEHWTRYQAKRALTMRDATLVGDALDAWVRSLDAKHPRNEHHLHEALGAYATIEVVRPDLLGRLLEAKDPRARAYATRIAGRWHDRLDDPLKLLARRVVDEHPQVRMEAVIACAAIPSARSMEVATRVIDMPMDHWIDYALTQAAHHLKPIWMPALQRGELTFAHPSHLAALLNRAGGRNVLRSLKKIVNSEGLTSQTKASVVASILAVGGPKEMEVYGLDTRSFTRANRYDADLHAQALALLIQVARFRPVRPSGDLSASLDRLIDQPHPKLKTHALVLAGIWKVRETQGKVLAIAKDSLLSLPVRAAAFEAMVAMKLPSSRDILVGYSANPHKLSLRAAAIQSLVTVDAPAAARQAAQFFGEADLKKMETTPLLTAFLNRKGGVEALASALRTGKLEPARAEQLLRALYATGRSARAVIHVLSQAIGASGQVPEYSEEHVKGLVKDAMKHGDAERGAVLFKSSACITCHRIGDAGGVIGPDLTSIGTTLSSERIVEELLWPNRQVKEGFSVVQVLTKDGVIHQGYERSASKSQNAGDLVMRELTSEKLITIKKQHIAEKRGTDSPMPTGLTALLTRPQVLDLIRYLSGSGKIK
ncbi:MAG: c-type cytochrome [Planctomycetota bacterium]|nr:c-type cytochrome [Planctomycetota bacterium]